jgi:CDGSH-type Zn-finger protein
MSKKQPFCDGSHKGTRFKSVSFKLAEKCDKMILCGCKLSKNVPFCDGLTCVKLKQEEESKIYKY